MTTDEKLQFDGVVNEDGTMIVPRRFKPDVVRLFLGKEITITVERKRRKRSLNQNAYYWAVVVQMICDAMNENEDNVLPSQVHEFLKHRFLKVQKIDHETGEILYEYSRTTTALKTFEFSLYIDQCIQFAAEYLKIQVPPPHTQSETYSFPEYQGKKEQRDKYLKRIEEFLMDIQHRWQLEKYFRQVPEWSKDEEIRKLFNERWKDLR